MIRKIYSRIRGYYYWLTDRQGYFIARMFGIRVPVFPFIHLPNDFSVSWAGKTGIAIADNFCTPEEANYLIENARQRLNDSLITLDGKQIKDDYRTSQTAVMFHPNLKDPAILPLLYRAGMLLGLPATHVETIFVTRYRAGEYYKRHDDGYPGFDGDRLYTVLIYLNDLSEEQGGGTLFEKLNLGVRPKLGRAVTWSNKNPDGSYHSEYSHEAMPVAEGAEKWIVQLWFRSYKLIDLPESTPAAFTEAGQPLAGTEALPDGTWAPGEVSADSPYGRAFS
jgi:prolyl 4-hydroxylase